MCSLFLVHFGFFFCFFCCCCFFYFFFNDTATTEIYTLSLHDALPICDLPLLDRETLTILVTARNPGKAATSMATRKTNLPEPLITIWEPQGLKKAKKDLECSKNFCPRKFLLNSQIHLVYPKNDEVLFNANSKTDFEYIQTKLNSAVHG